MEKLDDPQAIWLAAQHGTFLALPTQVSFPLSLTQEGHPFQGPVRKGEIQEEGGGGVEVALSVSKDYSQKETNY